MADASCPMCRKPAQADFRPFCSRGCKDRDLIKWLDGAYVAASQGLDEEDDGTGLDTDG